MYLWINTCTFFPPRKNHHFFYVEKINAFMSLRINYHISYIRIIKVMRIFNFQHIVSTYKYDIGDNLCSVKYIFLILKPPWYDLMKTKISSCQNCQSSQRCIINGNMESRWLGWWTILEDYLKYQLWMSMERIYSYAIITQK